MESPFFRSLLNVEGAFKLVRTLVIVLFTVLILVCGGVILYCLKMVENSAHRVYVIENGHSLVMALAQEANVNREAEAKDHIRTFIHLFFDLEPDDQQIRKTIQEASYLGDQSIVRLHKDFTERGYYSDLIQGNVHQKVTISPNDIKIDMSKSPYYFKAKGQQELVRESTVTIRNLELEGYLIDVTRTDRNSHGFQIEKLKTLDNSDIKTISRD